MAQKSVQTFPNRLLMVEHTQLFSNASVISYVENKNNMRRSSNFFFIQTHTHTMMFDGNAHLELLFFFSLLFLMF